MAAKLAKSIHLRAVGLVLGLDKVAEILAIDRAYTPPKIAPVAAESGTTYQEPCPFINPEKAMMLKEALVYIEKEASDDYNWLWEKIRGKMERLKWEEKKLQPVPKIDYSLKGIAWR